MIFVTVGTHEQPFNRLIKKVDSLVKDGVIKEQVVMQIGYSTYRPKYCKYKTMFSFDEMSKYIDGARIIITHGGPSSFIEVLKTGKTPIVVPRLKKYDEHINNHQVEFVKLIQEKYNNIIPIYNVDNLMNSIINYDKLVKNKYKSVSHNKEFNKELGFIVKELFNN